MRKVLTSIFVLLSAVAVCAPVRDATAAKNLPYSETPVYENLWYWPTDMRRCSPALPSAPHGFNFDTWYCFIASSGYTAQGVIGDFSESSVTCPRPANGYYTGRLLPLDSGIYQLSWNQDGYSAVAVTTYEWTGSAWKFIKRIDTHQYIDPGSYSTFFTVEEDGLAVALLFTTSFYAPEGTEVTFTDIELYKVD